MTNIRNEVWKVLDRETSLRFELQRGLINVRALARYLRKNGIEGSDDAIISAIRRYELDGRNKQDNLKEAIKIIKSAMISTRSNLVNIQLPKSRETQALLPQIFSCINYEKGEVLRIAQGDESIRIMIDKTNLEKVLEIIPKRLILEVRKSLSEINLHCKTNVVETKGFGALILNELFRKDILLYELMTCVPEIMIFVEDKELIRAYQVLFEMTKES